MLKKTITFTDYNGQTRTEDHYFNLNKAEVIEWLTTTGDYTIDEVLTQMSKKMNARGIMETFRDLIYRAYGEKSLDGRRFIKTPEVKANFMETEAYSVLFTELVTDAKAAADFFNAIIPPDLGKEVEKIMNAHPNATPEELRQIAAGEAAGNSGTPSLPEK